MGQHGGSLGVNGAVGMNPPTPSPPLPHTPIMYRGFEDSVGGDRRDGERKLRGKREEVGGVDKGERIPQLGNGRGRRGTEGVVKKRMLELERREGRGWKDEGLETL